MRRFLRCGLQYHIFLLVVSFLFIQGCARSVLQTYPAGELERVEVSAAFAKYQEIYREKCMCCLDAEADAAVSISGWFSDHTGKLSGYLQAMQPGYIKFVAINPLGQPLFILVTNGIFFKSLNVLESKAYMGSVHSLPDGSVPGQPRDFHSLLSYARLGNNPTCTPLDHGFGASVSPYLLVCVNPPRSNSCVGQGEQVDRLLKHGFAVNK